MDVQRGDKGLVSDHTGSGTSGITWHDRAIDEVTAHLASDADGLSDDESRDRLLRHGPNRLPEPRPDGPLIRFLRQFHNVLIYVLLGAAALTAVLDHWIDTGVILAVVVVNAAIGFFQEGKAEEALRAIRHMLAPKATVIRGGHRQTVPGDTIVPGDVVVLEPGDRVPADLRLMNVRNLTIQEAVLTGESVAVEKTTRPVPGAASLGDRRSLAFSGTLVTAGQGRGMVVATGAATEIGRISGLIAEVPASTTPLIRQISVFAKWLTAVILGLSVAILGAGLTFGGYGFTELFMAVVGLAVAAIPEGLPAILTVTLAIGVQTMARQHAIVRRLPAIEALGSVTVICSDKTGTLTRNEMMVATVCADRQIYEVSGDGYAPHGGFSLGGHDVDPAARPGLLAIVRSALLCSDASVHPHPEEEGVWTVSGDPMEGALVALAEKAGLDPAQERGSRPRTDAIPFDAAHRFMASLHHDHEGQAAIHVKGAPERVIDLCRFQAGADGRPQPLDTDIWHDEARRIAERGQRVLAIAVKPVVPDHTTLVFGDLDDGLMLLGLVGLIDPPREEAIGAVAQCRAAGIRVKMITGDHKGTAAAIARALGLQNPDTVLEGADLDRLSAEDLRREARAVDVFARTSPEHKLRLVEALQDGGAVVAMTGDGVNDAPALKRADIGIAMGRTGTEAAKEAAEIVLADDNFATITAAVKAGRTVYDNLKKAIVFLLPVNGGESLSLIAALLLGLTLPITPVQILWVNMVSSVVLAMTLAFEPSEPGVMNRSPRPAAEPILSRFVAWRVAFVSVLFCAGIFGKFALAQAQGADVAEARTIAVNTLVVMEIFYLFSVRYLNTSSLTWRGLFGTRPVLIAIAAVTILQVLFTYAPFMEAFFDTRPLSLMEGLQVVAVGVAVLVVLELEKRAVWAWRARRSGHSRPLTGPGEP